MNVFAKTTGDINIRMIDFKRNQKKTKISKFFLKKFCNHVALKSYNKWLEDSFDNQINFGCNRNEGVPVITETDVKFTKYDL